MRRLTPGLLTLLAVLLIAAGMTASAAAGAPGPRGKMSISSDRAACAVTTTFSWSNVDPTAGYTATVTLTSTTGGTFASNAVAVTSAKGSVSVTAGVTAYVGRGVYGGGFIAGAIPAVFSRTLTVSCR